MSRVPARHQRERPEAIHRLLQPLFGTEPAKRRPGYANFAIAEPPLKLILLENPARREPDHLGVEVADTTPSKRQGRRAEAGLASAPIAFALLLRQAGQVLGQGRARRRALGDLDGPGGQPELLGSGRRSGLECGASQLEAAERPKPCCGASESEPSGVCCA